MAASRVQPMVRAACTTRYRLRTALSTIRQAPDPGREHVHPGLAEELSVGRHPASRPSATL